MAIGSVANGSAARRGSRAWGRARRALCKSPSEMLEHAAALRQIEGREGRMLFGDKIPVRVARNYLSLANALEREAKRWEPEHREQRLAARRERARRREVARVAA